jgi:hypothetical protein
MNSLKTQLAAFFGRLFCVKLKAGLIEIKDESMSLSFAAIVAKITELTEKITLSAAKHQDLVKQCTQVIEQSMANHNGLVGALNEFNAVKTTLETAQTIASDVNGTTQAN